MYQRLDYRPYDCARFSCKIFRIISTTSALSYYSHALQGMNKVYKRLDYHAHHALYVKNKIAGRTLIDIIWKNGG